MVKTAIIFGIILIGFANLLLAQNVADSDRADVEKVIQERLQAKLDVLVGQSRSIAHVDVILVMREIESTSPRLGPRNKEISTPIFTPVISEIHVTIDIDNTLSDQEIEKIQQEVPKWVGLNPSRGDTLKFNFKDMHKRKSNS